MLQSYLKTLFRFKALSKVTYSCFLCIYISSMYNRIIAKIQSLPKLRSWHKHNYKSKQLMLFRTRSLPHKAAWIKTRINDYLQSWHLSRVVRTFFCIKSCLYPYNIILILLSALCLSNFFSTGSFFISHVSNTADKVAYLRYLRRVPSSNLRKDFCVA